MPDGPAPSSPPPHAPYTPGHVPQSGQRADYPHLFRGQTATPTQPVAPHLSSIGQPASGIVANGTDAAPYSAGPTASFPRFSPSPASVTPQSFARPSMVSAPPLGVTHKAALSSPAPWRRDRVAALVLTLLAVGIHVIWAINDASAHPAFPSLQNPTTQDYYKALYYIPQTLGAWWLILLPIPIITITRNQASTITTAAALQIFFIDTLILNNSIIGNPLPILCLLATGGAAIFTTLMGRTTRPPRQWLVNLGMAVNLFLLVSMAHRLMRLCIHGEIYQSDLSDYPANVWMSPSGRPDGQGIPLTAGVVIMIIVATIASISLYLGFSSPTSRAFRYTVGVAPALMALVNMYILSVFGLSGAIVSSVLGLTSIGTGAHPHAEFRAWLASILLALLAIGLTVLMHRNSCVRQHTPTPWSTSQTLTTGLPSVGAAAPTYAEGAPTHPSEVTGITPPGASMRPSAPNSW